MGLGGREEVKEGDGSKQGYVSGLEDGKEAKEESKQGYVEMGAKGNAGAGGKSGAV
jgi:hypothetical protein